MLSSQEEQREREEVMRQDADLRRRQQEQVQRESSGTYLSHTHDDLSGGGRFAALGNPTIVGSTEATRYPAAAAAYQIQLPDEPPLGFDNPVLEPSAVMLDAEQTDAPAGATSSSESLPPAQDESGDAGASLFQTKDE